MKNYTKIYLSYFNYDISDFMPCEFEGCGLRVADVHHIEARKMGGDPQKKKDKIENLMGVCRFHHNECEDKKISKEEQKRVHLKFMKLHKN